MSVTCDNCHNREVCFKERIKQNNFDDEIICHRCKESKEKDKPDKCIKMLPGVSNACCGHGNIGYITFENGVTIRGKFWRCDFK